MTISMDAVKSLRAQTSAGIVDCRKALAECAGDIEEAVSWLRKQGLAAAAKKAGRVAAEGVVAVAVTDQRGAVVEVNAETDFVARSDAFQELAQAIAACALTEGTEMDRLLATDITVKGQAATVQDQLQQAIATIGENIALRRAEELEVAQGVVAHYVHNKLAPDLGGIVVLVGIETDSDDADAVRSFGQQIAMHVAASKPLAVDEAGLDPAVLAKEREIVGEQARTSGRPENVQEKMIAGRMQKFVESNSLLSQDFVVDPDKKVADAVAAMGEKLGAAIRVTGFVRFALGEGIERKTGDFAAEVASMTGG